MCNSVKRLLVMMPSDKQTNKQTNKQTMLAEVGLQTRQGMTVSVGWLLHKRTGSSILPRGKRIVIAGPNSIIYPTILSTQHHGI